MFRSDHIFKDYVRMMLKLKVESSGFPNSVLTDEQKQNFASDYKMLYNVDLEPERIRKNPGLRFISKLMLNSLWYERKLFLITNYYFILGENSVCAMSLGQTR